MRTTTQILPGVREVFWIDRRQLLPSTEMYGLSGERVPVLAELHALPLFGDAECERKHVREGRSRRDEVRLEFVSDRGLPAGVMPGFVVRTVSGGCYLIGSRRGPAVQCEIIEGFGDPVSGKEGYHYSVTHVAVCSLIDCVI